MRGSAVALLLALAAPVWALSMNATMDPPRVAVGEPGELTIDIDGAEDLPAPQIPAPAGLTIRYVGPSTEVAIVNGRVSRKITYRYSVIAQQPGVYTIGPITVRESGKVHEVGSVRLEALASGTVGGPTPGEAENLSLTLTLPRTEVYLHERLPLTLSLRVGAVRVADLQYPQIGGDGFAIEKLGEPAQRQEPAGGGVVQVVEFASTLTPLRAGTFTVGPASMQLSVLVRDQRRDRFFGFFNESRQARELKSNPLVLTVLPLPDAGRPADFSGAVGQFQLEVRAAPLDPRAGDPVTVTATIRGQGNLDTLTPPAFAESDTLRAYPVQASTAQVPPGTRMYEQVVIPVRAGQLTLPPLRFSWFDPSARSYRTITPPPITLLVQPGAAAPAVAQTGTTAPATGGAEAPLGQDIVFIKDSPGTLRPIGARLYQSALFWLWPLVPLAAWIGVTVWDRRRQQEAGDPRRARATRAGREARAAVATAAQRLDAHDIPGFHDAIARAVTDYLLAKLDLPVGGVSGDALLVRLRGRPRARELSDELRDFLAACERARFTPAGTSVSEAQRTLARATAIIEGLEKERKLGPPLAALLLVALAGLACAADNPSASFLRAGGLYSDGRFPDAARAYEEVLAAGVESPNVYFNLGNAYFRAGDIGHAVLNYERARRLAPRDPDLLANLDFARSRGAEAEAPSLWSRLLFPLATRVTTERLLLGASVAWTILFALLIAGRLLTSLRAPMSRAAIIAGIGFALFAGSGAVRLLTTEWRAQVVVVSERGAPVRFEPSATGATHFEAKPGSVLRVVAEREGWAQVARGDGRRGWVESRAIERL